METLIYLIVLLPLLGSLMAGGVAAAKADRRLAHSSAIIGVALSFVFSAVVAHSVISEQLVINFNWYEWGKIGDLSLSIGFLVDSLTVMMMLTVNFVSLMVHVYTIGYMAHDDGYARFFAYISLFTFAMLMLVMANNFLQLFFGWEAVGLISYLLIGFWYTRPTAIHANLKAFLVNRVGDLGFLLGIGLLLATYGSVDYQQVFAQAERGTLTVFGWDAITVSCILLFVGAMGKSAQFPLHVWLPDSMEGPTPISALIHAATMVTAGIFMVARLSPLFELSEAALATVLVIGTITAFFMGLLGLVQNDIKRVVAYSTISQLGYMTAALGASAYSAAVFHLFTHAFFKALLFLAAGSVIIALHHEQNMKKMGGLRRVMPITYITCILGSLALVGVPPFSGFFSKDIIIEAVKASALPPATVSYYLLLIGAFVTALYSFRLLILTFHGTSRLSAEALSHAKESPKVVTIPLILLAIPSVIIGGLLVEPMVFGDYFKQAIYVDSARDTVAAVALYAEHSAITLLSHTLTNPAFWAGSLGIITAFLLYSDYPKRTEKLAQGAIYNTLVNKYWLDEFNQRVFADGARKIGQYLWQSIDIRVIDNAVVGTAKWLGGIAKKIRQVQSGIIYHYAFVMFFGVVVLLFWRAL